jgi:hypothetical protein
MTQWHPRLAAHIAEQRLCSRIPPRIGRPPTSRHAVASIHNLLATISGCFRTLLDYTMLPLVAERPQCEFDAESLHCKPIVTKRYPPQSSGAFLEEDDAEGQGQDTKVEKETAVLNIVEVITKLFAGILDRSAIGRIDLCPASDPGFYGMTLGVERDCRGKLVDKVGRSGRGPTMLMSPRNTLISWGSSSIRVRRTNRPIRVIRGSRSAAQIGIPSASASWRMLRNL